MAQRVALISISLALSQTPAYTARPPSSSSERVVGRAPLRSPSFAIISRCPGLLCSEMYVPENTTQPAASWSSWLSPSIRDWCGAGEQFNRHLQGVVCWCTFWQASDMPKESQPPVTDECTHIRQTCLFSNWWVCHEIWPPGSKNAMLTLRVKGLQSFAVSLEDGPCVSSVEEGRLDTRRVYPQLDHRYGVMHRVVWLFTSQLSTATHCTYPRRAGRAEFTWWLVTSESINHSYHMLSASIRPAKYL